MKRSTRFKMQVKNLTEFRAKHPKRNIDVLGEFEVLNSKIQRWSGCHLCKLKENRIESGECCGKLVINCLTYQILSPKILFVGLCPSVRRFDKELRAFKGVDENATLDNFNTSGDLFRLCLNESKIKDSGLWVTNLLKCSTPDNREPTQEEIDNHFQWLVKEIEILKPQMIVALGNTVFEQLTTKLKNNKIKKVYHPSYCMRDRTKIQEFIEQLNSLEKVEC